MKKSIILALSLLFLLNSNAQDWVEGMSDPTVNFYQVQADFNKYWKQVERNAQRTNENFRPGKTGPAFGFPQYKRWEWFWEPRVSGTDGMRPSAADMIQIYNSASGSQALSANAGDWTPIGPFNAPNGGGASGIGRINCITFHPTDNNTLWVGAPAGGLWKSTNGGQTWSTNTDHLPNLGVSAIAIDPLHPDTMFIATGDRDGGDTYSYGILKSVDGGLTWNTTGLTFNLGQSVRVGGLYINSINTQIIVAATRSGMYRSTNGGATWGNVQVGSFNMLAPDAQNPNTLFVGTGTSTARIWRSRDAGLTWTMLTNGLPTSGANRVEVAVSSEDSNYVYALYSANNNGFFGVYRSTDAGDTWIQMSSTPNILGWDGNGSGTGGQGWYDLALAVNPSNKQQIFVGGVNVWRSNNGGTSWTCVGHWYGQGGRPAVHADIHAFQWQPGTDDLYIASDGGVYETTNSGSSFTSYQDGMNITQYYKISQSISNPNLFLGGAQDNGTHRMQGNNWNRVMGGDGMDNGIDPDNNQIMYGSIYYGDFDRSTNGGATFSPMSIPAAGSGNWVTPFMIDPSNSNYIYAGYDRLYRSSNKGSSWAATSNSQINGTNIDEIAIAPSNGLYIYVSIDEDLFRSTNGGGSWSPANQSMPGTAHISGIAVSSLNPNHVWVTRSGYSGNIKVYESTDGGQSWINRVGSLPNLPVNCIVYEPGTQNGVYIGTDVGVYYRDDAMADWAPYMLGMPNVIVTDLEIYAADGKIRAGTYGRGIWEASVYSAFFGEPEADFVALPYSTCSISDTVSLLDASQFGAATWQWNIYPSTFNFVNGTTASSQNPKVVFTAKGQYTVTLTVGNQYGNNTLTKPKVIAVGGKPLPFTEDFEDAGFVEQWQISNPDNGITWQSATVAGNQPGNQAASINFYNYNGATGAKDGLISPALSFAGFNNINLTFDHAYRRYSTSRSDSLKVYISTNCGQSWILLASYGEDGTTNWVTAGTSTTAFVPTSASDWCGTVGSAACKSINLNAYAGTEGIRIKFEGVNGYGNNLYLDNINITGTATTKPTADFVGSTTGCSVDVFNFYDVSSASPVSWSWSFPGGAPATSISETPQVAYATGGTYTITLLATNAAGTDTIVKTNYVNVSQAVTPTAVLSATKTAICESDVVTLTANTTNAGANPTYIWFKNGGILTTGSNSITLSNIANGDQFFMVVQSDLGCIDNDSVASNSLGFTVTPQPNVSFLTNFDEMCSTDAPFQIGGGTPIGGVYSGKGVSNGIFDPVAAGVGSHIITYTYTNPQTGCSDFDTRNLIVNNAPQQPTISYANFILKASPIAPSYSYQWIDDQGNPISGATDTIYIPWVVGNYAVEIGLLNNCTNQSAYYNVAQIGLNEFTMQNGIGLYPNPARSEITLQFALSASADVVVSILDVTGRTIKQLKNNFDVGNTELQVDISELPAGAYFVQVNDGKQSTQRKFVKQ
jgi:PKD repeat protein